MIPKYANPLLLPDQTAVVSRAALRDSDDESEPVDHTDPERAQMLARLENILKRSIEDVLPTSVQHTGSQNEEQKRKKKRRKVEEELKDEEKGEREPVAVRMYLRNHSRREYMVLKHHTYAKRFGCSLECPNRNRLYSHPKLRL